MSKPNPTLNQVYANNAQVVDVQKALETAEFLTQLSRLAIPAYDSSYSYDDWFGFYQESQLWKLRAYTFLNRACELECVPIHKRLVETSNGLEEAWYTYKYRSFHYASTLDQYLQGRNAFSKSILESTFLGYYSSLTESQARMRALS